MLNYSFAYSVVLVFIGLGFSNLYSEVIITDWSLETSYNQTKKAISDDENDLWVATSGGVLKYNTNTGEIIKFNSLSGLSSNDASSIAYDEYRDIILVGYNDGNIDIIRNDLSIINVSDLKKFFKSLNEIRDFYVTEEKIYVGGQFGITELVPNVEGGSLDQIFYDTYSKVQVSAITINNGKLWLATNKGIYNIDKGLAISDPAKWQVLDRANSNLRDDNLKDIEFINDQLYVFYDSTFDGGVNSVVVKYTGSNFEDIFVSDYQMRNLTIQNNRLYATTLFRFYDILAEKSIFSFFKKDGLMDVLINPNSVDSYYLFTQNGGLMELTNNEAKSVEVNSFYSNSISDVNIDNFNSLRWIISNGIINKYDGNTWQIYNDDYDEKIPDSRDFMTTFSSSKGEVFIGDRFQGMLVISEEKDGENIKQYNLDNSPFTSVEKDGISVAVTDFAEDKFGNIWCVNWGLSSPGPIISAYKDGVFYPYENNITGSSGNNREYRNIGIDNYGTLWLGSNGSSDHRRGLLYLNNNGTVEDRSDDIIGEVDDNLPNNSINDIKIDKNDWLWFGTSTGVGFIFNPYSIYNANPNFEVEKPSNMSDLNVNEIYIDPINNKWFATETGLWVFDSDGIENLFHFDKDNSPLTTNKIYSLDMDIKTGRMYLGTENGLFVLHTNILEPKEEYDLSVYPQPYSPDRDENLIIDGLAQDTDVKITTIDGAIVKSIITQSGRAIWNGIDENNNKVSDGVYLIITKSTSSDKSSVTKVAVIND